MLRKSEEFLVRLYRTVRREGESVPEDFVTEAFAACLADDPELAGTIADLMLSGVNKGGTGPSRVVEVWTQQAYEGCRPDLFMRFGDGSLLAVEIKLAAAEGPQQLQRYLEIPELTWVALLAPDRRRIDESVLQNLKYVGRGERSEHVLWSDVYDAVNEYVARASGIRVLARGFIGLLDLLGFGPAVPMIGELHGVEAVIRAERRRNVGKLLTTTIEGLMRRGFQLDGNFHGQVYTTVRTDHVVRRVWVSAVDVPDFLFVKLYVERPEDQDRIATALAAPDSPLGPFAQVTRRRSTTKDAAGLMVEVRVALRRLSAGAVEVDDYRERFAEFVLGCVDRASSVSRLN